jgi:serine/threonine protein phosphatase PrpC
MSRSYKSFSIQGSDRKSNSDFIATKELSPGWIGIVCDGVGDSSGGIKVGKLCAEKIIELIESNPESDPLTKVKLAIVETNKYLRRMREGLPDDVKIATTLVVLYLLNHSACWAHVGDSRIYQLKNGRLNVLTKDHSVIQELVDKGMLTLKEAALHTGTNIIARAIGERSDVVIDVTKMNLQQTDNYRFILCTDGLTSLLPNSEIEKCLQKESIEDCYNSFISYINKDKITDDTSFLIVDPF